VVHGGSRFSGSIPITEEVVAKIEECIPLGPLHNPANLLGIRIAQELFPSLPQVAVFDTAFHMTMPPQTYLYAVPYEWYEKHEVRRYGFHGTSHRYVAETAVKQLGLDPEDHAIVTAHLGNGCSLCAVRNGKSLDTSMGFTPAAGLVMSTRTGDLDPGLAYYLARTERMTAARFQRLVNRESGLLGVSGISSDVRDLLAREAVDVRAAEAVSLFCYQAKKWLGSFAAALGGLDTIVFAGGIGENAPVVRERICDGLGFLGIELDQTRNTNNAPWISTDAGRVKVRVIRTDEELMIARSVIRILHVRPHPDA
jgi:acetate kinase